MSAVQLCTVLYIEDDPDDVFLFQRAFNQAAIPCDVHCVDSAEEARGYLLGEGAYSDRGKFPLPDLIVTDLALRSDSGLSFLNWVRRQPSLAAITVLCLTGSTDPQKLNQVASLGISVIEKTSRFEDVIAFIGKLVLS